METLSNELRELGGGSSCPLSKQVYTDGNDGLQITSQRSSIRGISVGSQFRASLQALVSDLDRTQPHYIRCVKPNSSKLPGAFASGEVLKQLRYSGMMEAIRIRREGYALREDHESFYNRFSVLLRTEDMDEEVPGIVQLVSALSIRLNVTHADWQIGHSKIFLRHELAEKLERLAKLRVQVAARVVGRSCRRAVRRRLSYFLTSWVRFRLYMLRFYRETKAANKVAATFRSSKERKRFLLVRQACVQLQSHQRRKIAVNRCRKLRDPYYNKTFHECKELLKIQKQRLDEAVKIKNFRLAVELESRV